MSLNGNGSAHRGLRLAGVGETDLADARGRLAAAAETGRAASRAAAGRALAYVELARQAEPGWLEQLEGLGLDVLRYQPDAAYLCAGTPDALRLAQALPWVVHVTLVTPELKPTVAAPETGAGAVVVLVRATEDELPGVLADLRALDGVRVSDAAPHRADVFFRVRADADEAGLQALLDHPHVAGVEPYAARTPEDEVAGLVVAGRYDAQRRPVGSYLAWLHEHGLSGEGVTIGVVDTGVEVSHPAFAGRARDLGGGTKSWHGTFVAGHAAGAYLTERDDKGFIYGLGMAPHAELLAQDSQHGGAELCRQTVREAGPSGVPGTIQNNSWGQGLADPMTYGSLEATFDRAVRDADPDSGEPKPLTVCFSAGNSGDAGLTRPKGAKNIIVTGNSEIYRPAVGGSEADDIGQIFTGQHASSHGNCGDGRIRPDVVAPGEWTASANYDSHPGEAEYISPRLTWGGGTSGASPKTAGACALLTQWWRREHGGRAPSPAMLRALVVNGAEPLAGARPVPNPVQGWGRLHLGNVLAAGTSRLMVDQTDELTPTNRDRRWTLRVVDPARPVKVTLAWTDPPGNLGTGTADIPAVVNRLVLHAEAGSATYRGNRFNNGWSVADDVHLPAEQPPGWDNLQNVFLAPGVAGDRLTVRVQALEITTNCHTTRPVDPRQDFALMVTNGVLVQDAATPPVVVVVDPPSPPAGPEPAPVPAADPIWGADDGTDEPDADSVWGADDGSDEADPVWGDDGTDGAGALAGPVMVVHGDAADARTLADLRRAAAGPGVHLVGVDAGAVDALHAKIGARAGVHRRVARDATALPVAVARAAAAAAGEQRLELRRAGPARTFTVVAADARVRLVVHATRELGDLTLTPPGGTAMALEPAAVAPGITVAAGDGVLVAELTPAVHGTRWAGTWRLEDLRGAALPEVQAFAHTRLPLDALRLRLEAGLTLVEARAWAGARLTELSVRARRGTHEAETARARALPARLDRVRGATAAPGTPGAATLRAVVPAGTEQADLDVLVHGRDAHGAPFARHLPIHDDARQEQR